MKDALICGKIRFVISLAVALIFLPACSRQARAAGRQTVDFPVTCIAQGIGEPFTYDMSVPETGAVTAEETSLQLKGGENGHFRLSVTEPGIYTLQIRQKKGSRPDIDYDESVYVGRIVALQEPDGLLQITAFIYREDSCGKSAAAVFRNVHRAELTDPRAQEPPADVKRPEETDKPGTPCPGSQPDGGKDAEKSTEEYREIQEQTDRAAESGTGESARPESPQTGDDAPVEVILWLMYFSLLVTAGLGLSLIRYRFCGQEEEPREGEDR